MYEQFFGLQERPFDLLPNPKFLFLSARQREAVGNLRYGLQTPRGLTLLLGDAGTGKTTLVNAVLSDLDPASVECVLISNPTLTRPEFYEALADGFHLPQEAQHSKVRFLAQLRAHLEGRRAAGLVSALVLDEAQSMSFELLEEVRLLSNIDTSAYKLLNVVLAGQPELANRLNDPNLRQLKQRISLRCELAPLDLRETAAYIAGRVRIAGGEPGAVFTRDSILTIHQASNGVPRTINVICDNSLIGAFAAQTKPVGRAIVDEICRDFDLVGGAQSRVPTRVTATVAVEPEPARASTAETPAEVEEPVGSGPAAANKRFVFF